MSFIEIAREDRVLRLTLNRPEKKNALSAEFCTQLADAFDEANSNSGVGCVLLEARGDVFCAGMDLSDAIGPDAAQKTAIHERLFTVASRSLKPIVAAVAGPALGGGVGLLCNAHIVVAAHGCNFGLTEIRIGMWPFIIWRAVVATIGERRATELALTGRIFSVNEAVQWGLVHEVAPAFELDDRASATAHHLAESAPQAIRLGLEYLRASRGLSSDESGRLALQFRTQAFGSEDYREGVTAFQEKRRPVWPKIL
ncbi:MAG: enoyl-CoA hydratase/isomerase family protein [Bryobacteraceae bacterium]|nr:enoyl-CoA hydratase/isomerase family protein [Bryobacteraceae bacterium]